MYDAFSHNLDNWPQLILIFMEANPLKNIIFSKR